MQTNDPHRTAKTPMTRQVGSVEIRAKHRASCHCGAVVLELDLPDGIVNARRCNCSICKRKGAAVASVPVTGLNVLQGAESLQLYQFNTRSAKHYFCKVCGIHTHNQSRSQPGQYAYNVGCLEDVNPNELGTLPVSDGVNHIADRKV